MTEVQRNLKQQPTENPAGHNIAKKTLNWTIISVVLATLFALVTLYFTILRK